MPETGRREPVGPVPWVVSAASAEALLLADEASMFRTVEAPTAPHHPSAPDRPTRSLLKVSLANYLDSVAQGFVAMIQVQTLTGLIIWMGFLWRRANAPTRTALASLRWPWRSRACWSPS